jgi:hypothetical protein
LTEAVSYITAVWPRWLTPPVKQDWSFKWQTKD